MIDKRNLPEAKSFYRKIGDHHLAAAEFTLMPEDCCRLYYFSRLITPVSHRNQGHATALMKEAMLWFDDNQCDIILDINPYGDLNLEQLIKFYSKFRFVYTPDRPRRNQMARFSRYERRKNERT